MATKTAHSHAQGIGDDGIFIGLLALLVWAPLPLGSNRYWAIGLLLLAAVSLLVATAWVWRNHAVNAVSHLHSFRIPIALLGGLVLLTWLQILPLPGAWVAAISPMAATVWPSDAPSMTLSIDVYQTHTMAALAFAYFSVFLVALLTVRDAQRLDLVAQVLVWSGVLQAVLGAVLFSLQAEYRIFFVKVSHLRMIGSFVYHNSLAAYLCMCLSIGIGLMLARLGGEQVAARHWKAKVVAAVAFVLSPKMRLRLLLVVMVISLVLTRSRMGNTAFFAALLIVGIAAVVLARKTAPQTIALVISLIVIDVLVVGTGVGLEKVVERIQQTELTDAEGGASESVEARTEAARTSLPIVQDFPLVGTGGGSFYNIFLSYRTPKYGYTYVDHTHNDYVEIATDYGLIGLGLLGFLVALTLFKALQTMARRKSRVPWGLSFGVAMAIVALLFHSTVDFNLQIPANALTIVVILAMGWVAATLPSRRDARPLEKKEQQ